MEVIHLCQNTAKPNIAGEYMRYRQLVVNEVCPFKLTLVTIFPKKVKISSPTIYFVHKVRNEWHPCPSIFFDIFVAQNFFYIIYLATRVLHNIIDVFWSCFSGLANRNGIRIEQMLDKFFN